MKRVGIVIWSIVILFLLTFYAYFYLHLKNDLKTIFDEGLFFLCLKPADTFVTQTSSLSLSSEVLKAIFPRIGEWDVLALRRLAYGIKGLGIVFLLFASCYFLKKEKKETSMSSYLALLACVLLMGLFVMPSVVISSNDMSLFFEMTALSFCLLAISTRNVWEYVCIGLTGLSSFFAMLFMPPGGGMLSVLCFLFLILYGSFDKKKPFKVFFGMFVGAVLGTTIMHFFIISLPETVVFFQNALVQTTNGSSASHHSLIKLAVQFLLNIKDLIITLTMLCGITFMCDLFHRKLNKKWLTISVGIVLFVILYKWQVKPEISFASIITWLLLMTFVMCGKGGKSVGSRSNMVLLLFFWMLPFGLSLGSNLGFLYKTTIFIVPWGVLLFFLSYLTKDSNQLFSKGLVYFIFAFVLISNVRDIICQDKSNTVPFTREYPIARMQLDENQFAFYNEVYSILNDYNYKSKRDTILGFCFNEMTIVAMDAVPYSNDQLPEEFLLHDKNKLVKPEFMILSEWDERVLLPYFDSLNWDIPNSYDVIKLQNNPDPNSGWGMAQSSMYCLKSLGPIFKEKPDNDLTEEAIVTY